MFRHTRLDFWGVVACVLMLSISSLFYIIVGQYLFSKVLRLAPISGYAEGWAAVKFLVLPILLSLLARLGGEARLYRAMFLEEIGKDYVRTARAKGLSEVVVLFRHVLRNALIPVVTLGAIEFGRLLAGAVLTEQVFTIPGFGKLIVDAVFNRDYPVVQGVVLATALIFVLLSLVADLLYMAINPRLCQA